MDFPMTINVFTQKFVSNKNYKYALPCADRPLLYYDKTYTFSFKLVDRNGDPYVIPEGALFRFAGDTNKTHDDDLMFLAEGCDINIVSNAEGLLQVTINTNTTAFAEKAGEDVIVELIMDGSVILQDCVRSEGVVYAGEKPPVVQTPEYKPWEDTKKYIDDSITDGVTFVNPDTVNRDTPVTTTVGGLIKDQTVIDRLKLVPILQKMMFPFNKPEVVRLEARGVPYRLECGTAFKSPIIFGIKITESSNALGNSTRLEADYGAWNETPKKKVLATEFDPSVESLSVPFDDLVCNIPGKCTFTLGVLDKNGNGSSAKAEYFWNYFTMFFADTNDDIVPTAESIANGTYRNADGTLFNSAYIRSKATKMYFDGADIEMAIPEGSRRVVFAVPAGQEDLKAVTPGGSSINYIGSFIKSTINIAGEGTSLGSLYNIYIYQALKGLTADVWTFKQ